MAGQREKLESTLRSLSINTVVIEHPEVFTVDTMMPYLKDCKGLITKNLFLKGKKKKDLWLISIGHDKQVNLGELGKTLSVPGGFRFADETILEEKLGVKQGCVTPLAVLNDVDNDVILVLDSDIQTLCDDEYVYSHPMVNSATIGMKCEDFNTFLKHTSHTPRYINVERKTETQ